MGSWMSWVTDCADAASREHRESIRQGGGHVCSDQWRKPGAGIVVTQRSLSNPSLTSTHTSAPRPSRAADRGAAGGVDGRRHTRSLPRPAAIGRLGARHAQPSTRVACNLFPRICPTSRTRAAQDHLAPARRRGARSPRHWCVSRLCAISVAECDQRPSGGTSSRFSGSALGTEGAVLRRQMRGS
jgi:hypothetical protein